MGVWSIPVFHFRKMATLQLDSTMMNCDTCSIVLAWMLIHKTFQNIGSVPSVNNDCFCINYMVNAIYVCAVFQLMTVRSGF